MATVYQRPGSDYYYAKFFGADGKRKSKNTGLTKKREAEREAERLEAEERGKREGTKEMPKQFAAIIETAAREAAAGDLDLARAEELMRRIRAIANPNFREVSVKEWFAEWIAEQKERVGESTSKGYGDALRRLTAALGPKASEKPLTELTIEDVGRAINTIAKTVKAATANLDLGAFRRAMEAAQARKLVSSNVAKQVRRLPEDDSEERAPFTMEEVRKLIDKAATDEWKGLILVASQTGLRMGDVLSLGRSNIVGTSIVIRPEKTKRSKKTITVPMSPPVMGWIGDKKGSFFPTLSTKTKATISTNFARLMERAKVDRETKMPGGITAVRSFHSLRHSFASWLAEADIHADVRQKLTGHSSSGVHAKYSHHDESLARAIATLPEL